jgi:membrane-associated protease RseP (regulator of RpoE activity)
MMKLAVILVAILAAAAEAQQTAEPAAPNVIYKGAVMGPTVKGAPYSATETIENTQTLADGTRIDHTTQTMIYRDTEGRMRRETPDSIDILDPVANTSYLLDPKTQTARQMPLGLATVGAVTGALQLPLAPLPEPGGGAPLTRFIYRGADPPDPPLAGNGSIGIQYSPSDSDKARAMLKANGVTEGVYVAGTVPGSPAAKAGIQAGDIIIAINGQTVRNGDELTTAVSGTSVGSAISVGALHNGKQQTFQMVVADRAKVYPAAVQVAGPMPVPAGVRVLAPGALPMLNFQGIKLDAQTESLGHQTIQGVDAEGTRITSTIAAGAIGNDRPIQIITERWYSSDLHTNVKMMHSDPRSGQETFQLTGISRTEPAPYLFQVPAGYQLVK